MTKVPRTCILCQHFSFDAGESYGGDTGGTEWESHCTRDRWEMQGQFVTYTEYIANLLTAVNCAEFSMSPDLPTTAHTAREQSDSRVALWPHTG